MGRRGAVLTTNSLVVVVIFLVAVSCGGGDFLDWWGAILDSVAWDPQGVIGGGWHAESPDVFLVEEVECAHVVWDVETELVVGVIEGLVQSDGALEEVVWDIGSVGLKSNVLVDAEGWLAEVVSEGEQGDVGSVWSLLAAFGVLEPCEHDSLGLSVPGGLWALWVALTGLWLADDSVLLPWASSVLNFSIEHIDNGWCVATDTEGGILNGGFNFCDNFGFGNDLGEDFSLESGLDLDKVGALTCAKGWGWRVSQL